MHARHLMAGTLLGAAVLLGAGCGSSSPKPSASGSGTTAAPGTTASAGGTATTAASSATTGSSGPRLDNCAATDPKSVAMTYLSSIAYAGADTYMQCVYQDTVPQSMGASIKAKNFSSLSPTFDAAANTVSYTAPDGTKLTLTLTKEANGKFYVTNAALG